MTDDIKKPSRRDFVKTTGVVAAASVLANVAIPHVHAAADSALDVVLIGCGGRGGGAAADALRTKGGPIKLTAMADTFEDRLKNTYNGLAGQFSTQVDVPDDRKFVGIDAYKHAIDCLKPGGIAIMATPPAFRWVHFKYAIEKGVNVFMEKPVTVDGGSTRRMLDLYEQSVKKNMKVGVGLMCRHSESRRELFNRIQDGQMGDIVALRCYRQHGPVGTAFSEPRKGDIPEVQWQIRRFHSFLWASGGCFSDFYIHNIDECCWMKNAWPVKAEANGGRMYRGDNVDQNFDNYSVEYTFADGAKLFHYGRTMAGCQDKFSSYVQGSKGAGVISENGHAPAHARIYKSQAMEPNNIAWQYQAKDGGKNEPNPYQDEWNHLTEAIRQDQPYNEVKRGAEASLVTAMGRYAAHTGQPITYDEMLKTGGEFAPDVDKLSLTGDAPVKANAQGKYPIPLPGLVTDREY